MQEIDVFKYVMAAEKVQNLGWVMGSTLQFFEEYGIKPDDEVRKALEPLVKQLNEWMAK